MSKFGKGLRALAKIVRKPSLLNLVLDENENWKSYISKKYPHFSGGLKSVDHKNLFDNFEVSVEPYTFLDGGSMPTDLALLNNFARKIDRCSYFEIGTWRGESVANVARFAHQCHTLNLSVEDMRAAGLSEKYIKLHFNFSENLENVTQLYGNSRYFYFDKLGKKFDLIFIDGDHHYEMVRSDTEKVFRHLMKEKSIVVWHDYASNPEKIRYEVLAGILDGLPQHLHNNLYHFSNSLSAFLYPEELKGKILHPPVEPGNIFRVNIKPL
jgi:predicted O-methyltransferase YrrM